MALLLENIPYFNCLVRREFTTNFKSGRGQYLKAKAFAVYCRRSRMVDFQVLFLGELHDGTKIHTGGAMFAMVPITAICSKPCPVPKAVDVAPWDVFSEKFTVVELELLQRMKMLSLIKREPGRYLFSIDFYGSDLADDPSQHKQLHISRMDNGTFTAFPNNRILMEDPAMFETLTKKPNFESDPNEYFAE